MDNSIGNSNLYRNLYSNYNNSSKDLSNSVNELNRVGKVSNSNNVDLNNSVQMKDKVENGECKTCQERKYKDVSNDASVSFQTPTHISPENAASKVTAHEMEHVVNEKAYADEDGRELVSQYVTLQTGICPECGRTFVAGGETVTTTRAKPKDNENDFFVDAHKKFLQGYFGSKIDTKI